MSEIRVTVWNEFIHEKSNTTSAKLYPEGMHETIAAHLNACDGLTARTATIDQDEHGQRIGSAGRPGAHQQRRQGQQAETKSFHTHDHLRSQAALVA